MKENHPWFLQGQLCHMLREIGGTTLQDEVCAAGTCILTPMRILHRSLVGCYPPSSHPEHSSLSLWTTQALIELPGASSSIVFPAALELGLLGPPRMGVIKVGPGPQMTFTSVETGGLLPRKR